MTDDNVISIGTRRSLAEEQAEVEKAQAVYEKHLDESAAKHKANMLEFVENLKARIEADELDGLAVAGRNPLNGAFLSVLVLETSTTRVDTYLAYAGILGALQLDATDLANAGPHMNPDGTYFAVAAAEDLLLEDGE